MAEKDEGALERAEGFFKKVLGRIGASVDEKMGPGDTRLPAHVVGALAASLEQAIEANVRPDVRGIRRVAPDRFEVKLTYEHNSGLTDGDRKALARELAATAYEYIANHRYETLARIYVEVGCDLFARKTVVDTSFSPAPGESSQGAVHEVRPPVAGQVREARADDFTFLFVGPGGKPVVRACMPPGGEPVTVGRAAGNRLLVDHDSVSKFHATLTFTRDNRLLVADLGSTNGTFVGRESEPIEGVREITPGTVVVFGEVPFRIERVDDR
jgi:hypothetical protein